MRARDYRGEKKREEKEKGKRERSSLSAAIAVPQLGLEIAR